MSKAEKKERAEPDAAWQANEDRVALLGRVFDELPTCEAKDTLQLAMRDRIITLYNEQKFEEGDAILEFLPNEFARRLLDWYFDEEAEDVAPDLQRPTWDEHGSPSGSSGQSLREGTETAPNEGSPDSAVASETPADQGGERAQASTDAEVPFGGPRVLAGGC